MNAKSRTIFSLKNLPELVGQLVLLVATCLVIFPIVWMFFASFKAEAEVFSSTFTLLPQEWHPENYATAWNAAPFGRFYINSILVAAMTISAQLFTCSLAGYSFAKLNFPLKKVLFTLLLMSMILPEEAAIIPNYLFVQKLGLMNTYLGIALPTLTGVFGIFLMRQNFMQIPDNLLEAAKLDGCNPFQIFYKIALPISSSALATVALLAFVGSWNEYMWPFIVTNSTEMRTLQIGLKYMISADLGPLWPMLMAAAVIVLLPVMIVFVGLQKYFVAGMAKTGIK